MYLLRYVVLYFKFLIMFTHNNNLLSILIEYGKDIFLEEKKKVMVNGEETIKHPFFWGRCPYSCGALGRETEESPLGLN